MLADRQARMSWKDIAARHGVSLRTAQRAVDRARRAQTVPAGPTAVRAATLESVLNFDAVAELRAVLDAHQAAIKGYAELAAKSEHDHVRMGALSRGLDAHRARFDLLERIGAVPRLHWWAALTQIEAVMALVSRALNDPRADVPPEVIEDMLREVERHMPRQLISEDRSHEEAAQP